MPAVQLPNNQIIVFPDDMPQDAISAAVRNHLSGGAAPATTMGSMVHGAMDPIHGGAQFLTHALPTGVVNAVNSATRAVNEAPIIGPITKALGMVPATSEDLDKQVRAREQDYQNSRIAAGDSGFDWPRVAGGIIPAVAVGAASKNPSIIQRAFLGREPSNVGAALFNGARQGALAGAMEPVVSDDYEIQKAQQVLMNAGGGAIVGPLAYGVGRAIAPKPSDSVRALHEAGVPMTPGQIIGGGAKHAEDALTSVPFLGTQIARGQMEAREGFNRAVANRALDPIGAKIVSGPAGRDMVGETERMIGGAYTTAYGRARPFSIDPAFGADIQSAFGGLSTPSNQSAFMSTIKDKLAARLQNGALSPEDYQKINTDLRVLAQNYSRSASASERELGQAFGQARNALQDLLARTNPHIAGDLKNADTAWAAFARMRDAAQGQGVENGVFTPAQLSRAVRSGDYSVGHGKYARGDALLQDLSDAGRSALGQKIPDSGTARRAMMGSALTNLAAMQWIPTAETAATIGALYGAYSPLGRKAFQAAAMAQRPGPVSALGNAVSSSGGLLQGPITNEFYRPIPE